MNDLLPYLLKSTFSLSLLYLAFRSVMHKEAYFTLNRMVLLAIVVSSVLIPLVILPRVIHPEIQQKLMPAFPVNEHPVPALPVVADGPKITPPSIVTVEKPETPISVIQTVGYIYLAGMLFSILILFHGLITLFLLYLKAEKKKEQGHRIFILEKDIPAFSFCRMIFISKADYMEHGKTIITHEIQHIRLGHFYDLMLMEMVKMVHWFNPIIYWLIQDLKAIHEFQADRSTLTTGINVKNYQLLIIEKGVGSQRLALANSFNHCQIKKRITMMNQPKNGKAGIWKVAIFLPVLALLLMAFGRTGENVEKNSPTGKEMLDQKKTIVIEPATQSDDSIYSITEVLPQFPGGEKAFRKYITENINYPESAKAKKIQGKVFVSFIVDSQGNVTKPKIVRGIDPELDAEALRIISLLPKWKPGEQKGKPVKVSYTTPVYFTLSPEPSDNTKKTDTLTPPIFIEVNKQGVLLMKNLVSLDELRKQLPVIAKKNPQSEIWLSIIDKNNPKKDSVNEILKKAGVWSKVKYK